MSQLYPTIEPSQPDQTYRIKELDDFLAKEAEERGRTQKKYQRAINAAHGVFMGVGVAGVSMETAGISLLVTGVGTIPGIVLAALDVVAFGFQTDCDPTVRRWSRKAMKHAEIARRASDKLNSVHKKVSEYL